MLSSHQVSGSDTPKPVPQSDPDLLKITMFAHMLTATNTNVVTITCNYRTMTSWKDVMRAHHGNAAILSITVNKTNIRLRNCNQRGQDLHYIQQVVGQWQVYVS